MSIKKKASDTDSNHMPLWRRPQYYRLFQAHRFICVSNITVSMNIPVHQRHLSGIFIDVHLEKMNNKHPCDSYLKIQPETYQIAIHWRGTYRLQSSVTIIVRTYKIFYISERYCLYIYLFVRQYLFQVLNLKYLISNVLIIFQIFINIS